MASHILSLVERGWQGARECSLEAQGDGVHVVHLVKGWVDPAVRALIPPHPRMRFISVPKHVFWPLAWLLTLGYRCTGRLCALLIDNERSQQRLRSWPHLARTPLWCVRSGDHGYELWAGAHRLGQAPWQERGAR